MSNIAMQGGATGTGTVTLLAPSTSTDRTLTLPDATGTVITNTAGVVTQTMLAAGVAGNGPAFSAYSNVAQSLANNTAVKIQFNVEEFDTNNCFDSTTNYRFIPNVAGYYSVTAACNYSVSTSGSRFLTIYKNGSGIKGTTFTGPNGLNYCNAIVNALIYLNGSTDYVEVYAQQNSGGSLVTGGSQSEVFFCGSMIRGA